MRVGGGRREGKREGVGNDDLKVNFDTGGIDEMERRIDRG